MTGFDRATVRRLLHTLVTLGYVQREGRAFQLTPRILDLAYIYFSTSALWNIAEPVMKKLVSTIHESCAMSVLDGTEIVYVMNVPAYRIMTINLPIGSRLPAYCTSQGRVLLGDLSRTELDRVLKESNIQKHTKHTVASTAELKRFIRRDHERGWSLQNQELEEGVCSIAVPIQEKSGRVIAAMNVTGSASRLTQRKMISTVLPRMKRAAQEIHSLWWT